MLQQLALPKSPLEGIILFFVSAIFFLGGVAHFTKTGFFLSIMPPWIPYPRFWVYFTGVCEVLGACGLWFVITRYWAAWALIVLSICVFPVNIYMAYYSDRFPQFSIWALYTRLPIQFVIIFFCYWLSFYE